MDEATCVAYNEEHLRTWKEASKDLFSDVPNITSYRYFMLVGADDYFSGDLGCGVEKAAAEAPGTEDFPSSGRCYSEMDVVNARNKLAKRSLVEVLKQLRAGTYRGVGSGNPRYGGRKELLQLERPAQVTAVAEHGMTVDVQFNDGAEEDSERRKMKEAEKKAEAERAVALREAKKKAKEEEIAR